MEVQSPLVASGILATFPLRMDSITLMILTYTLALLTGSRGSIKVPVAQMATISVNMQ
jgi:hypothetical protein